MKKVYTCFCTDTIHEGHLNIINEASKLGEVTVGVLSDEQMIRYNRFPLKTTEERVRNSMICSTVVIHLHERHSNHRAH